MGGRKRLYEFACLRARRSVERRLNRPKHTRLRGLAEKAKQALADVSDLDIYEAQVA